MFKNVIAPVQAWLLSRGQCVGCGMPLKTGRKATISDGKEKIICKCGRIFIHEIKTQKFRRALFEEV